jgi:hypothetical protein
VHFLPRLRERHESNLSKLRWRSRPRLLAQMTPGVYGTSGRTRRAAEPNFLAERPLGI